MLVQRRTATKDIYPSHHDLAAGGVVAAGESYEACAEREVQEELGIRGAALERKLDFYYEDAGNRCFGRVFTCVHEGPFALQAEEVESVAFLTAEAIARGYPELPGGSGLGRTVRRVRTGALRPGGASFGGSVPGPRREKEKPGTTDQSSVLATRKSTLSGRRPTAYL